MADARPMWRSVSFLCEDDLSIAFSYLPRSELDQVEQTCRQFNRVVSQYMPAICLRPVMSVAIRLLPEGLARVVARQDLEWTDMVRVASMGAMATHLAPILRSVGKYLQDLVH